MTPLRPLVVLLSLLLTSAALAQSANLRLIGQSSHVFSRFSMSMALFNNGPDIARNTVITIDVPTGVTIFRAFFGVGDGVKDCDITARAVRCELGDFHVGLPVRYGGIDIDTPLADANYSVTARVTSDTPDPVPTDNTFTASWRTRVESDLNVFIVRDTDRVDPGGTGRFTAWVCNEVQRNRPPTVRVEFTAANGTIQSVTPASGFLCTNEQTKFVCTLPELSAQCPEQPFQVTVRASDDRRGGEATLTVEAFSDLPEQDADDNRATGTLPIYRWLAVTNVADAGPGSLRNAITQANASCTPGPCRIVFEIPGPVPSEGWFTITPSEALPSITAERVTLEGLRQSAFTGNTNPRGPEIAIYGRLARRGIRMLAPCEAVVNGLAIGNFDDDQGLWISTGGPCGNRPDKREVTDNHIGVDPIGDTARPNRRGLRADFSFGLLVTRNVISSNRFSGVWMWRGAASFTHNLIEDNGASGIFLGPEIFSAAVNNSVIRRNREMGVAAARDAKSVQMRRNVMKDNGGLGIDWGLDGLSPTGGDDHAGPSNAPVLLSAQYDAATNTTSVTASVTSSKLGPYLNFGTLEFFANASADGDGEQFLGADSRLSGSGTITVSFQGDHRGKWINATWTREHLFAARTPRPDSHSADFMIMTSELSNTVLVQ